MPSAVMNGPGMCSDAPDMNEPNGIPQALTWNIGTNVRILSRSVGPVSVAAWPDSACRNVERWEYTTPLSDLPWCRWCSNEASAARVPIQLGPAEARFLALSQ